MSKGYSIVFGIIVTENKLVDTRSERFIEFMKNTDIYIEKLMSFKAYFNKTNETM